MAWLFASKSGCASQCEHRWDFFDILTSIVVSGAPCCSCNCDERWSCFWDMTVELRIAAFFEWDIVDVEKTDQLRLFEDHVVFE